MSSPATNSGKKRVLEGACSTAAAASKDSPTKDSPQKKLKRKNPIPPEEIRLLPSPALDVLYLGSSKLCDSIKKKEQKKEKGKKVKVGSLSFVKFHLVGESNAWNVYSKLKMDRKTQVYYEDVADYRYDAVMVAMGTFDALSARIVPCSGYPLEIIYKGGGLRPAKITSNTVQDLHFVAEGLVRSCGEDDDAKVMNMAWVETNDLSLIQTEELRASIGLRRGGKWNEIKNLLKKNIACKNARAIEFGKLAILYLHILQSTNYRIAALQEAASLTSRASGWLKQIPDSVPAMLSLYVRNHNRMSYGDMLLRVKDELVAAVMARKEAEEVAVVDSEDSQNDDDESVYL